MNHDANKAIIAKGIVIGRYGFNLANPAHPFTNMLIINWRMQHAEANNPVIIVHKIDKHG